MFHSTDTVEYHHRKNNYLPNQTQSQLTECDGVLLRQIQLNNQQVKQLLLPAGLRQEVLHSLHDQVGHQSPAKTLDLARCYWTGMAADTQCVSMCQVCAGQGNQEMSDYNGITTSKTTTGCSGNGLHVTGTRNQPY